MKSVAQKVKASCLYLYHRPEPVGFVPGDQAFAAFVAAVAVAAAEHVAAAGHVAQAVNALVDPAHVASAVAVADGLHAALVGSAPVLIHDAFVVVAAAAEQLRVVVVAVAAALVLRLVHLAAVVVAQVALHVQLALHHDRLGVVAVRRGAVRVARRHCHAAVEPVAPVAQLAATMFAPFVARHVPVARLSP